MSAVLMDGKSLAKKIKEQVRCEVEQLARKPGLAVILVGENPATRVYVDGKTRDCRQCGIYSEEYALLESSSQQEVIDLIETLNDRDDIDGIMVQMPLPEHMDAQTVLRAVRPDKDLDCVHPYNLGQLMLGQDAFQPCTPAGIMRLLDEYGIDPDGKTCVVVGRSSIVGKPLAMLMVQRNATVTISHTHTRDLHKKCARADILVTAAGQVGLITGDMIKEGAVVVDVAINRNEKGELCGDVVYEEGVVKASYITPIPGGVGPMTRAMLMHNALEAAKLHEKCRMQNAECRM